MFESLSNNLKTAIKSLKGAGKITEINIASTLKEIRRSLVKADVHYNVAKQVTDTIKKKALGTNVLSAVSPGQLFTRLVRDELALLMGTQHEDIRLTGNPAIILVVGLQGAGKTTLSGKLALHFKKKNKQVLLVACDIYRPAAATQLKVLGEQIGVSLYADLNTSNASQIATEAIQQAKREGNNVVIIDTAGRLGIDTKMMEELIDLKKKLNPSETLFVVDAMAGQDAVNTAKSFNEQFHFDGIVLTKLDGDARGGAALSIRNVVEKPIKLVSTGEKLTDLDLFHPDRMANRILGMGDVISLVEKADKIYSEKDQRQLIKKISSKQFNLNDFISQIKKIKKMGSLKDLMHMLPGVDTKKLPDNLQGEEKIFDRFEVIVNSMTPKERTHPMIINQDRRYRIAKGSGTSLKEVNGFLKQFDTVYKAMKQLPKERSHALAKLKNLIRQ